MQARRGAQYMRARRGAQRACAQDEARITDLANSIASRIYLVNSTEFRIFHYARGETRAAPASKTGRVPRRPRLARERGDREDVAARLRSRAHTHAARRGVSQVCVSARARRTDGQPMPQLLMYGPKKL